MALAVVTTGIKGLPQIAANLEKLEDRIRKRVLTKGMRAANKIVLRAMRALVPKKSGRLKRALGSKVSVGKRGVAGVIGPKKSHDTAAHKPTKTAHLVEKGTSRGGKSGGRGARGPSRAYHFEKRALESTQAQAVAAMLDVASREVQKEIAGIGRK